MNDMEYFGKLSEFVSPRIGNGYGDVMAAARALHHEFGGAFQTTFSFVYYVLIGINKSEDAPFRGEPIEQRVAQLLEYVGASEEDTIVADSRRYFGDRFVFNNKLHTLRVTEDEREVMLSLIEEHLGDDSKLPVTSESLIVASGLARKLNGKK